MIWIKFTFNGYIYVICHMEPLYVKSAVYSGVLRNTSVLHIYNTYDITRHASVFEFRHRFSMITFM